MSASVFGAGLFQQGALTSLATTPPRRDRPAATTDSTPDTTTTTTTAPAPSNPTPPPSCYGYHNTFHTHSNPIDPMAAPPSYAALPHIKMPHPSKDVLPDYSCSIALEGAMGMKCEFRNLFEKTAGRDREWQDYWLVLSGTCLNIHRLKQDSIFRSRRAQKQRTFMPGKIVRSYSLQHAEVGLALDFKRSELIPKSPLAKLVPLHARQAVYETDPDLFFPVRENVLRLRLETEQLLISCPDAETMLNWIEHLCAAVDISPPIEDRSEPRYRSLPRRGRRQRQLDNRTMRTETVDLNAQRLLAEQERIINTMYPNLGAASEPVVEEQVAQTNDQEDEYDANDMLFPGRPQSPPEQNAPRTRLHEHTASGTAEEEEADYTQPITPTISNANNTNAHSTSDRKTPTATIAAEESSAQHLLRYRRRCAPVLLHSSPRASDVVLATNTDGQLQRYRVNMRKGTVAHFKDLPPHYSAHNFTAEQIETAKTANLRAKSTPRPNLGRGTSGGSTRSSLEAEADLEDSPWGLPVIAELDFSISVSSSSSHAERRSEENESEAAEGEMSSLRQQESVDSEPPSPTTNTAPQALPGKTVRRNPNTINRIFGGKFALTSNNTQSRGLVL